MHQSIIKLKNAPDTIMIVFMTLNCLYPLSIGTIRLVFIYFGCLHCYNDIFFFNIPEHLPDVSRHWSTLICDTIVKWWLSHKLIYSRWNTGPVKSRCLITPDKYSIKIITKFSTWENHKEEHKYGKVTQYAKMGVYDLWKICILSKMINVSNFNVQWAKTDTLKKP
jgi:hypothetical protein